MIGDVRNTIQLLEYPRVPEFNPTPDEILEFIDNNKSFEQKYQSNLEYYMGKNVAINAKKDVDKDNPDSRLSVSYARTMTQIIKGYMYKPGLITYDSKSKAYLKTLDDIFDKNIEPLKTSELGEAQTKYGLGVELLYTDEDTTAETANKTIPRFTVVKPQECVFIFNMDLEPTLIGTIRYYIIDKDESADTVTYRVEVYFVNKIDLYEMVVTSNKRTIALTGTHPNFFGMVPFSLYPANQEYQAIYEATKTLIDAYDILSSDSINEMQRFASAYLLLKNYIFSNASDGNEKTRELEKLKTSRIFEFIGDASQMGAEFLTKDIPSEFFKVVKETLREDIEYHSHVPDFRSKTFEASSGVAMRWSLFDFENLCGDLQAQFELGLQKRILLINNLLEIKEIETDKVNIKFDRNIPQARTEMIENFVKVAQTGKLPDEDLLNMLPDDIVDDVKAVMRRMEKQKEANKEAFDLDMEPQMNEAVEQEVKEDE